MNAFYEKNKTKRGNAPINGIPKMGNAPISGIPKMGNVPISGIPKMGNAPISGIPKMGNVPISIPKSENVLTNGIAGAAKLSNLSDNDLYKKCQEYGGSAKLWARKFAGLIPEVYRRQLYRKKGFISIQEFAKKLGGMSEYAVERILHLSVKLQDKPILLNLLETGEQGWSKIEKVAYVATPDTDKQFAEKVKQLPTRSLEVYVQNYRRKSTHVGEPENKTETRQPSAYLSFPITVELEQKLRVYKQKLEKERKEFISWGEAIEALLKGENFKDRQVIIQVCPDCAEKRAQETTSRTVPTVIENVIRAKYGDICAFKGCKKPWVLLHHIERFSINKSHDPKLIVPLCKIHHDLAHAGLIANEKDSPDKWFLREEPGKKDLIHYIDQKIQQYKKFQINSALT